MTNWVYRVSDGQWCLGIGPDPAAYLTNPSAYSVASLPDGVVPDARAQKWNGTLPTTMVPGSAVPFVSLGGKQ